MKQSDPAFDLSLQSDRPKSSENLQSFSYGGIRAKRIFAYVVDVICIGILAFAASIVASLLGIITLGLLSPILALLLACVPVAYHTATIGGPWHATVGMRLFGIEVSLNDGRKPDYITAFVHSALFYFTMALTSMLILLVSIFNPQGKLLHDYLTNSTVHNSVD
ncbi:MAG: RDD family protein [Sneathiellales bacterium]|nr:RDD family protein [Sneathiellales bacterium]